MLMSASPVLVACPRGLRLVAMAALNEGPCVVRAVVAELVDRRVIRGTVRERAARRDVAGLRELALMGSDRTSRLRLGPGDPCCARPGSWRGPCGQLAGSSPSYPPARPALLRADRRRGRTRLRALLRPGQRVHHRLVTRLGLASGLHARQSLTPRLRVVGQLDLGLAGRCSYPSAQTTSHTTGPRHRRRSRSARSPRSFSAAPPSALA